MLKNVFMMYNDDARLSASGQMDIFSGGVPSREEILKNAIKHPEVVGKLQEILSGTKITSQSENRIVFESDTHKMIVSRMKGSQPTDNWLLTAYEKKRKARLRQQ